MIEKLRTFLLNHIKAMSKGHQRLKKIQVHYEILNTVLLTCSDRHIKKYHINANGIPE